jgi:hypothetical protein
VVAVTGSGEDGAGDRGGPPVSRRALLAGVATVGASGTVVGRTHGLFSDSEDRGVAFTAGGLDLGLAWQEEYRPREGGREVTTSPGSRWTGDCAVEGFVDDPPPAFGLAESIRPGDSGTVRVALRLEGNPGWLYLGLGTDCPSGPLAAALSATATLRRCDTGERLWRHTGTLAELLVALAGGVRPAEDCLDPGLYRLDIEWEFGAVPRNATGRYEDATVAFGLNVHAVQCRHNDSPDNPVDGPGCRSPSRYGISFIRVYTLDEKGHCTAVGKVELEDHYCGDSYDGIAENRIEPGTYPLFDRDCSPTPYRLAITDTRVKTEAGETETTGVALALLGDGDGDGDDDPRLCRVDIKGGPEINTYASASDFEGNATVRVLDAPLRSTTGSGTGNSGGGRR